MANLLTVGRILLVIPFTALFFIGADWAMSAALVIFTLAALTDFLDGWIARKLNETSALGAALDPIADKLLTAAALLLLIGAGVIRDSGLIGALIILLRETLVGGLREALATQDRGLRLPVTGLAKIKTAAQLIALALYIAAAPSGLIGEALRPAAAGVFWLAVILTFWTGADYTQRAVVALRADPAEKAR